jgi:hypothetical protein
MHLIKHHTLKMCGGVEVRKMSAVVELFNRFCKVECTKKVFIFNFEFQNWDVNYVWD